MNSKQQTGLYFGTFNPIHIGHTAIANYIKSYANLDELWFVISPQSPFKKEQKIADDRHRLEMVRLAIDNTPGYRVSDIEFSMPKPSYTIDTITYLKEKYPKRNFSLIMGSDNLATIHKWKNYTELLKQCQLIVYPRPGFDNNKPKVECNSLIVDAPLIDISSSFIRQAIADKHDVRFFLSPKVWSYIYDLQLYR